MPEYIDRDATIREMKMDIEPPFKVVMKMPAADVVPKSEYDRLKKLFNDMTQEAKGYLNRLYGIRADVAIEIFEDLEKIFDDYGLEYFNSNLKRTIDELKKKYTEG